MSALRIHQVNSDLTISNVGGQQVRAGFRFYLD